MDAMAKVMREASKGFSPRETPSVDIDLMASRWENGRDIWTGEALAPHDRHDWQRIVGNKMELD